MELRCGMNLTRVPIDRRVTTTMTLDRRVRKIDPARHQFIPIDLSEQNKIHPPATTSGQSGNALPRDESSSSLERGARNRSSSLELILGPLLTSTRTRL